MGDPSTYWPDADRVPCPFAGSIKVNINDLMWQDSAALVTTAYDVVPVASMTGYTQGSKAANQAYLAQRFIGVAKEQLTATQVRTSILVDRVYVGPMTITSGTYYQGDLITFVDNGDAGVTMLSNAVEKTSLASSAIGYVLVGGVGVTTVTVVLISRVLPKFNMPTVASASISMNSGANISTGTDTGTIIATAAAQKLGFWGATAVIQQASNAQNAVITTVGSAVNATNAVNTVDAPNSYGFASAAQANMIVTNVNALRTDVLAVNTLVNRLRADLVTVGIIKGSM
jgi:hypothetical protein